MTNFSTLREESRLQTLEEAFKGHLSYLVKGERSACVKVDTQDETRMADVVVEFTHDLDIVNAGNSSKVSTVKRSKNNSWTPAGINFLHKILVGTHSKSAWDTIREFRGCSNRVIRPLPFTVSCEPVSAHCPTARYCVAFLHYCSVLRSGGDAEGDKYISDGSLNTDVQTLQKKVSSFDKTMSRCTLFFC